RPQDHGVRPGLHPAQGAPRERVLLLLPRRAADPGAVPRRPLSCPLCADPGCAAADRGAVQPVQRGVRVHGGTPVRALIAALIGCCGLVWCGPRAIAAKYLAIDLIVEPEHLPKFVCVLVADPPACVQQGCSVAISKVRAEAHDAQAM